MRHISCLCKVRPIKLEFTDDRDMSETLNKSSVRRSTSNGSEHLKWDLYQPNNESMTESPRNMFKKETSSDGTYTFEEV